MSRAGVGLPLSCILLFALALRAIGLEKTFVGEDEVVFWLGDPGYHARLVLYSFVNFPSWLAFDTYMNFPHGLPVPSPPLYDLVMAGIARLGSDDPQSVEYVMAWSPAVIGTCTILPVYAAARSMGGQAVSLAAATIYALLGIAVLNSAIGNADHHAAVGFLGALLLALCLGCLSHPRATRELAGLAFWLGLTRAAIALTWSGSLLYLGLGSLTMLFAGALGGRRDLLALESASGCLAALAVAPVCAALPTPLGGAFSAIALSWLHVTFLGTAAAVAALLAVAEWLRPSRSPGVRLLRLAGIGAAVGALTLAGPALREGLLPIAGFVSTQDELGRFTVERSPLFGIFGRSPTIDHKVYYGYLAYLIPFSPLAGLLAARTRGARASALALAGWSAVLGWLALTQFRYGNDFAAAGAISLALALGQAAGGLQARLGLRRRVAGAIVGATTLGLLWPSFSQWYLPWLERSVSHFAGRTPTADLALATPSGSLARFMRSVRDATPETSGFLEPTALPEYGVLASGNIGHALRYGARRPTSVDGMWEYADREIFERAGRFLSARSEDEALAAAAGLRARYAITDHREDLEPGTLAHRLHVEDGLARGDQPRWEHFRLVTEGPPGGRPLGDAFGLRRRRRVVPYKLYEIVEGAVLEVRTEPGVTVEAEVTIRSPMPRRFGYRAEATANPAGMARIRVPYATQTDSPVRPAGPYRVKASGLPRLVHVSEEQVRSGAAIPVDLVGPVTKAVPNGPTTLAARSTRMGAGTLADMLQPVP